MWGSTSTWVFASTVRYCPLSGLWPGFERSNTVSDAVHAHDDTARLFHISSVPFAVSSKTPTWTFSVCVPFLVVTERHSQLESSQEALIPQVFLPPTLFTHTSTFASRTSAPPSKKLFSVIKPGNCLPSQYPSGILHLVPSSPSPSR